MLNNPFRPGFATQPPVLAGREALLRDYERILATRGLAVGSFQAVYGNRGLGKTVLQDWFASLARERGWAVVQHEARPGDHVLTRILDKIQDIDVLPRRIARTLIKTREAWGEETQRLNLGVYQRESHRQRQNVSERFITELADTWERIVSGLGDDGRGLAVLIDEAQNAAPLELSPLGPALQQLERTRTGPCAVTFTGLPDLPEFIVNAFTYGERLTYHELSNLDEAATVHALAQPLREAGWQIEPDALQQLVDTSGGYPYVIQLYGYHTISSAADETVITAEHVAQGIAAGRQNLDEGLYRARWSKIPDRERRYLATMASLDTNRPVKTGDVAERLGKHITELSETRALLIERGILTSPRRGEIQCTLPGFLDHIRRQHPEHDPSETAPRRTTKRPSQGLDR